MQKVTFLLLIGILLMMSSCRDDFNTVPSNGSLSFSKDTIYLDTVFTNIGSSTYTLKVYNRSSKDISIPKIQLAKADSKYRLLVDGMTGVDADNNGVGDGKVFNNIELLAKDSLFIFVETTAKSTDANPSDFLYTDEIQFDSGTNLQKVNLVTLVQNATFLYPKKLADGSKETLLLGLTEKNEEVRINGFELNENDTANGNELHFTNEKPYVIYGYAGIPAGKTLVIDAGARVHFHSESGIIVQPEASLNINGTASPNLQNPQENEVVFEADRLEPDFEDVPGQWGTVWIREGSTNNYINHLTLKNATVGLLIEKSPLQISNSQIYNTANIGILARTATIIGENLIINSAGQASLACSIGGNYTFKHSTINNNWNSSKQVAVSLSNYEQNADGSLTKSDLIQANFYNCIIYGSNSVEIFLDKNIDVAFHSDFKYCLFKFNDSGTTLATNSAYDFIRNMQDGNIKNEDPKFYKPNQNKLNIDPTSAAFQKGSAAFLVATDILGISRSSNPPDLGAYQSAEFPK